MINKEFPILEFDSDRNAMIRPERFIKPIAISEKCVISFFADANGVLIGRHQHTVVAYLESESMKLPIYQLDYQGEKIALVQAVVGAPNAAAQIEELTALGYRKFIACGGCGVLQKDIAVGHLIIPTAAVRDEGTSYHYLPPTREVSANDRVIAVIESTLTEQQVPFIKAKTWTTDAFYRETPSKIELRKSEGCVTVEMEAAAFMAAAEYNNVDFGQILYAGDSLVGEEWDKRGWVDRTEIREFVLQLALAACIKL